MILDSDLAPLYGTTTKRLNEQVKRNASRFPDDFLIQLTWEEADSLRSQIATLKSGRGQHRKHRPFAFTEHGALAAAFVVNTPLAAEAGIEVVRAFVRLRQLLASHVELARRVEKLEREQRSLAGVVGDVVQALEPPAPKRARIGFRSPRRAGPTA